MIRSFVLTLLLITQTSYAYINTPKTTLTVGWELWYPYQYHNKKQQLVGLDIESFNTIAQFAGYQYSYTELPWKRHLLMIRNGEMDVAMGASKTKLREEYAYFTEPYRTESVNLFIRKGQLDKIKLNNLSDLIDSPYTIGVEGGYYYGTEYQSLISDPNFQAHINEVVDLEQNVDMLLKGHLDGFLVDPITMKAFVEKYHLYDEFEAHPIAIYQADICIMLSKKTMTAQDLAKFNLAIKQLKENKALDKILNASL